MSSPTFAVSLISLAVEFLSTVTAPLDLKGLSKEERKAATEKRNNTFLFAIWYGGDGLHGAVHCACLTAAVSSVRPGCSRL